MKTNKSEMIPLRTLSGVVILLFSLYFYCLFMYFYYYVLRISYCMFMYLHRASWHSSTTLTEVFPCFFLSCRTNARAKPAKTGHGPHSSKIFVLFYVLFVLCRSVYCVCVCVRARVNVYCTSATGWLPNCN